ncbi:MAG: DNA recombination protein RmuC [Kineosporiaceae bacterium]
MTTSEVAMWVLAAAVLALGAGLAAGFAAGLRVARWRGGSVPAVLEAENGLLRERVRDLEAADSQDHELAATLAPLAGALQRVERQVAVLERDRVEQYARLDQQLTAFRGDAQALRRQTAALAGALRSPSARGAWGEVQLRRVVEHAGMLHRVDFSTQVTGTNRDDQAVRPDLVVHLPGGKHVVVDAKAPLAAFLEAAERAEAQGAETTAGPEAAGAHARALRAHVDALAAKEYWTAVEPSPEFVVCFVPGEAFLSAACAADPALLEHAMGRKVVLATPTTLLALLRTVALGWQTDALAGNAQAVFDLGRELYGRLATLGGHAGRLGRSLHRAVEDYNAMVGALERRVLVSARKLRDLDLTDEALPGAEPLDTVPRPLSTPELLQSRLLDDLSATGARPGPS